MITQKRPLGTAAQCAAADTVIDRAVLADMVNADYGPLHHSRGTVTIDNGNGPITLRGTFRSGTRGGYGCIEFTVSPSLNRDWHTTHGPAGGRLHLLDCANNNLLHPGLCAITVRGDRWDEINR